MSDRQPLKAPTEADGAIEIEFAGGTRMRITGVVDAATLKAAVVALADGPPR
jgi:transposase